MDVECWHCFEPLKNHFVKGEKLLCNKIDPETNECSEYYAAQDVLDDEDVYSEVVHGYGENAKNYALLPVGESMDIEYEGKKWRITKTSDKSTLTGLLDESLTDKIRRSKVNAAKN